MHPYLNTAINAAREAGKLIVRAMDQMDRINIESKGLNDLVTSVDKASERIIIEALQTAYPDHAILAEESGEINRSNNPDENLWIIDPLDGTMNFAHGFPHFSISIAMQHKKRTELALIYDPIRQDLFTAERGSGAQLNNRRLRVTKTHELKNAMLGTGFPFKGQENYHDYFTCLESLSRKTHSIRRAGSAALDLAYVAAGFLDGFWQKDLAPWDIAAGALLIKEAGGLVSDFNGGESHLETGNIVAANPKLFKQLLKEVAVIK